MIEGHGGECVPCIAEHCGWERGETATARRAVAGVLYGALYGENGRPREDLVPGLLLDAAADFGRRIDREELSDLRALLGDDIEERPRQRAQLRFQADQLAHKLSEEQTDYEEAS